VPIDITLRVGRDRPVLACFDNPGEQEILEHLVILTERTGVPAKPVEGQ
jgi:hypothetical protein